MSNNMVNNSPLNSAPDARQIKVWVLAPHVKTNDANLDYYYDFSQSIAEYETVFAQLNMEWTWQPVTMDDYAKIIDSIAAEADFGNKTPVVLNLCDGDEINGTPGISVVKLLEEKQLIYTGADEYFYRVTTSKIPMKKAFDQAGVPTAPWRPIVHEDADFEEIFDALGNPVIVKPAVSGGSMGVGIKNVVENSAQLHEQVVQMFAGYRGWQLATEGLIAESFISGPEFTVFISGSYNNPAGARIYTPVERVFHHSLPDQEKFLSFDRLWEIYEEESAMPGDANFYEYALPEAKLVDAIKKVSWDAFTACKGTGYCRADVRMDKQTGRLYVLEVNAQCGLSEDEDFTSIGAILRFSNSSYAGLVQEIINDAFIRNRQKAQKRRIA